MFRCSNSYKSGTKVDRPKAKIVLNTNNHCTMYNIKEPKVCGKLAKEMNLQRKGSKLSLKIIAEKKDSPGWVGGCKSSFKDCLQQSKMLYIL